MNHAITNDSAPSVLVAKGNCGIPEWIDGKVCYNGTPEIMAQYAVMAAQAGARIVGGCCGTTPNHVRAMRNALDLYLQDSQSAAAPLDAAAIEQALGSLTQGAKAQLQGDLSIAGGAASEPKRRRRRRD